MNVSSIWKRFLYNKRPQAKLIVLGKKICDAHHSNYLDLLDLPLDFNLWLKEIKDVQDFPFECEEITTNGETKYYYTDTWESCIPIIGQDMEKKLQSFLEGHGTNSLSSRLIALRATMIVVYDQLQSARSAQSRYEEIRKEWIESIAMEEWKTLNNRWVYYLPNFKYLPFYKTIKMTKELMLEVEYFFDSIKKNKNKSKEFISFKCHFKIDLILETLQKHIEPYSKLERYCPLFQPELNLK